MMCLSDIGDAVRFLTRVPMPSLPAARADEPAGFGAAAFPLVGLLLGVVALGADVATGELPHGVRDVGILALWALLTGALHYDGLADVLDALGPSSREERLRVMRDATLGTFAVLGLVFVVAVEIASLGALDGHARHRVLLVAPMLGRLAMLLAAFEAPRAREDGLGAEFSRRLGAREVLVAGAFAVIVAVLLWGLRGAGAIAVVGCIALAVRRGSVAAFGGISGDVLGACGKLAEVAVLVLGTVR